jgi:two-component system, LytTR family, response regulator
VSHTPVRAVIIEDSPRIRETVKLYLYRHFADRIIVVGEADDVENSVELIRRLRPQLLLLDIELMTGTCFDVLDILGEEMRNTFTAVMITQFDKYLKQALRYGVVDYVDKPILTKTFVEGIERGIKKVLEREATEQRLREDIRAQLATELSIAAVEESSSVLAPEPQKQADKETLYVRNNAGQFEMVAIRDITYCLASGSYTFIHGLKGQPILDSRNLKHYEAKLLEYGFLRVSRSLVVNPAHCHLVRDGQNAVTVVLPDASRHPVEATYTNKASTYLQTTKPQDP